MTRIPVTAVRAGLAGGLEVQANGQVLQADSVVVAVPHDAVGPLLPPGTVVSQDRLVELGTSPIVNVHLVYDRPVTDLAFFAGVGTDAQFVFDRTEGAGLDDGRQCLAVSLSAAETYIGRPAPRARVALHRRAGPPAAPPQPVPRSRIRSSPANIRPPSSGCRARTACAPAPSAACRACTWRGPGPTRAGRPRWRGAVRSGTEAGRLAARYASGSAGGSAGASNA